MEENDKNCIESPKVDLQTVLKLEHTKLWLLMKPDLCITLELFYISAISSLNIFTNAALIKKECIKTQDFWDLRII